MHFKLIFISNDFLTVTHLYVPPAVCHRQHVKDDEKNNTKCTGIRHFGNTIRMTNDTRVCTLTRNWLNEKNIYIINYSKNLKKTNILNIAIRIKCVSRRCF